MGTGFLRKPRTQAQLLQTVKRQPMTLLMDGNLIQPRGRAETTPLSWGFRSSKCHLLLLRAF